MWRGREGVGGAERGKEGRGGECTSPCPPSARPELTHHGGPPRDDGARVGHGGGEGAHHGEGVAGKGDAARVDEGVERGRHLKHV